MKIKLRGHHLLCLQGFQGYGYNDSFVKNMTYINNLRKSENTTITITNKADYICRCCPNLKNDLCGNEKQNAEIIKMDNEGQYIPFCTRMVFLKYYTPSAGNQLHFWGESDRKAYIDAINRVLGKYLPEKIV